MRHRLLFLSLLLTAAAAPLHADAERAAEDWPATQAAAVERLESLATRANGRKLFRSRNEIYEEILRFDPEHAKARSWLKYKRRDGAWVRRRYTAPKDRGSKSARAKHAEAVREWREWWRQEVLRVHHDAANSGDVLTADAVLRFALRLQPEDRAFRALAGEVLHGEGVDARWVLADTAHALANRARYLATARDAATSVAAAKPGVPTASDRGDLFSWPVVLNGETVRVLGTASPAELKRHHQIAEASSAVFTAVFGIQARLPALTEHGENTFPLYVAATREQGNRFLATEPGVAASDMALLADLDLSFLPMRPGAVVKTDSPSLRCEATAHAVHAHFARQHLGLEARGRGAWAQEAVELYLSWLQVGTRLLHAIRAPTAVSEEPAPTGPFGRPLPGSEDAGSTFVDSTTDWYAQAAAAIATEVTPEKDLLSGYGVAVYVLEAHPEHCAAFFRDVATQSEVDLDAVLTKHLRRDLTSLQPHLLRWLREMSELAPARQ